jgi:hypothetical protein
MSGPQRGRDAHATAAETAALQPPSFQIQQKRLVRCLLGRHDHPPGSPLLESSAYGISRLGDHETKGVIWKILSHKELQLLLGNVFVNAMSRGIRLSRGILVSELPTICAEWVRCDLPLANGCAWGAGRSPRPGTSARFANIGGHADGRSERLCVSGSARGRLELVWSIALVRWNDQRKSSKHQHRPNPALPCGREAIFN